MTLRAFDVDDKQWRESLVLTAQTASSNEGRQSMIGRKRAEMIVDGLLHVIREHAENLDPLVAEMRERAAEHDRQAALSAARTAALERAIGVGPVEIEHEP